MSQGRTARMVLGLVAAGGVAAGVALFAAAPEQERLEAAGQEDVLREVATRRVERVAVRPRARFSGVLEPRRTVRIHAETNGPVLSLGAEELDRVEAGQVLVRLDPVLADVEVERALAAVARAESEQALAESHLERQRELAQRQVLSDSVLEDAENRARVARASLREARALLRRAREDLDNKTVAAPFAGELRTFPLEQGEYVREGQVLAELVDFSSTRIEVGVGDREVVALRPGQPVRLEVEAYPERHFQGRVLRVGSSADPASKRFPVEVDVPNPEGRLLPGMVARVFLDLGDPALRTVVPRDATVDEFGLHFVYVVERNGQGWVARQRRVVVRPIPFRPRDLEVVDGLREGERIATTAVRQLRDGERVRPHDPDLEREPRLGDAS